MSKLNRRNFLRQTAIAGGTALALGGLFARDKFTSVDGGRALAAAGSGGYGPLSARASNNTGEMLLRLPEGFQYIKFIVP